MIDCSLCRDLIDRDVVEPLDPQDRTKLANHLRSCTACVTYRKDKLKDSSILKKSVDELKQKAVEASPPPPPVHPSLWPWIIMAGVLVLVVAGAILIVKTDPGSSKSLSPPGPGKVQSDRNHRTSVPTGLKDPSGARKFPVAKDPSVPAPPRIQIQGKVLDGRNQPMPDARIALVRSPHPSAECFLTRSKPDGSFRFEVDGAFPAYVTAWKSGALSMPVAVHSAAAQTIRLQPGRTVQGVLQPASDLTLQDIKVMALWTGAGRTLAEPGATGTFRLTLPLNRSVEVRPYRDKLKVFNLVPDIPLALASHAPEPIRLTAMKSNILALNLVPEGGAPPCSRLLMAAALPAADALPRFFEAHPLAPGTYHISAPPGGYRIFVWQRGFMEVFLEVTLEELVGQHVLLKPSSLSLRGTLHLQPSSQGVEVPLTIRRSPSIFTGEPVIEVPMDDRGRFEAVGLPWSQVVVEAGYALKTRFGPFTLPLDNLDLRLQPGASIQGVVRDTNGASLADLPVTLESQAGTTTTYTDGQGHYRFSHVPPVPTHVYPRSHLIRFESYPALKNEFRILLSPGSALAKDLVVQNARPCKILLRDQEGRPVVGRLSLKSPGGSVILERESILLAKGEDTNPRPVLIPPLSPGTYQVNVEETGVLYPLGSFQLPADLNLEIRRNQPKLVLKFIWQSPYPLPALDLKLTLSRAYADPVHTFQIPPTQALEIGGLVPGDYEVGVTLGGHRARGLARISSPGSPDTILNLYLR